MLRTFGSIVLAGALLATPRAPAAAQGIGVPPAYDHGMTNLATLQVETAVAVDQPWQGSSAFRIRWDWPAFAFGALGGVAFGEARALLLGLTPQVKLFNSCDACTRRIVAGAFADAALVTGGDATALKTGSLGVGAAVQSDLTGFAVDFGTSARVGVHRMDAAEESDTYFGAAIGAAAGIPAAFELFANLDYMSTAPRPSTAVAAEGALTVAVGLRVRIGPGT